MELTLINFFFMLSIPDTNVEDFSASYTENQFFAIKRNNKEFATYHPGADEIYFKKGWKSRVLLTELLHLNYHAKKNINLTPEALKEFFTFLNSLSIPPDVIPKTAPPKHEV